MNPADSAPHAADPSGLHTAREEAPGIAWPSVDPALRAALASCGPKALQLLRPTLFLLANEAPADSARTGATRLGGRVDVASGFAWPRLPKVGAPLAFLAQFDLAALQPFAAACALPVPRSGRLLFFYDLAEKPLGTDPTERPHWRVLRDPMPETRLRKHPFPEDLPAECTLSPMLPDFRPGFCLPNAAHPAWAEAGASERGKIAAALALLPSPGEPHEVIGALGGWAPAVTPPCLEARAAQFVDGGPAGKASARFRSLLWLRVPHGNGLTIVFLIEATMLAERRFEEVIVHAVIAD